MKKLPAFVFAIFAVWAGFTYFVIGQATPHRFPHIDIAASLPAGACSPANSLEQWNGDLYTCDPSTLTWRILAGSAGSGSPAGSSFAGQYNASGSFGGYTISLGVQMFGAKVDGSTNDATAWSNAFTTACSNHAQLTMPIGTSIVPVDLIPCSNIRISGAAPLLSQIKFTGTNQDSCVDLESLTNVEIDNLTIIGASGACTRAIKVNNSSNIRLHDLIIQGGGSGNNGVNPPANLMIQGSTNVTLERSNLSNDGSANGYPIVIDYFSPTPQITSSQIHIIDNVIVNANATISLAGFQCQVCDLSGNDINEGNKYVSGDNNGYGILSYAHPPLSVPTTGATVNGTTNLTLTFPANTLPATPLNTYSATIAGISTCTGTQPNGTFAVTITSPTTVTLTSTGSTCSSASLTAGTYTAAIRPAHVTIARNRVWNTAGTGIYLASSDYATVTGNTVENCAQQQHQVSLPVGCIAVNGGTGSSVTGNTINVSGQAGIDVTNPVNIAIGTNTINNAANQGIRVGNTNGCQVAGNTITGGQVSLFVWSGTADCKFDNVANSPAILGFDAEPGTTDNIFHGVINAPLNNQGYVDAGTRNHWDSIKCNSCYATFSGTDTFGTNDSFYNLASGNAVNLEGVKHGRFKSFHADTVNQFVGAVGISTDVIFDNSSVVNAAGSAYADGPPVVLTGTVSNTSCTITALSTTAIPIGSVITDLATGNLIPSGSTVVSVNTGASSLVFSNAGSACATGNATESVSIYPNFVNGLVFNNLQATGNFPSAVQGFISQGSQNIHLVGGLFTGFYFSTQSVIDFRGTSCSLPGQCSVGDGLKTDSSGVGYGLGITGQTSNLTVNNIYLQNTGNWAVQDVGTGKGNSFRTIYQNAPGSQRFNMTNTNSVYSVDFTAGFAGVPANAQVVTFVAVNTPFTVPANCLGSYAGAKTAATGTAVFNVVDHAGGPSGTATTICSATFSASGTVASFSGSSGGNVALGDYLEIDGPATADATLATLAFGIAGIR